MLILTRKPGQSIKIQPDEKLDPETPVGKLFGRSRRPASRDIGTSMCGTSRDTCTSMYIADGPIEIIVTQINGGQVKLGIVAHPDLKILRDELDICKDG
ncbi:MAG: hypothetical protein BMS9Abin02_2087 [Anaerolineae bacterium]|nr:MAG: hypothetical protein BMS9Abin02_2087 [Anaerolineae bacterium]